VSLWIRPDLRPLLGALSFEELLALGRHRVRVGPGGRRETSWFERDGRRFYLKVHAGVGWGEILKCWLQGKRPVLDARPEAQALGLLARHEVPVPRLAAHGVRGLDPARRRSFVLTEALEDTVDLAEELARVPAPSPRFRAELARALGGLVARLHAAGLAHQDLYLTHFRLRRGEHGGFELFLLDLHRARRASPRAVEKDLAALRFSTFGLLVTRADCARFWRAYRAPSADEPALRRRIERRARAVEARVARRGPAGQKG